MLNEKAIKVIGITTTVLGMAVTLVNEWVNEKTMDAKIAEKVADALAKK